MFMAQERFEYNKLYSIFSCDVCNKIIFKSAIGTDINVQKIHDCTAKNLTARLRGQIYCALY